mmetsp:Transcript_139454/g.446103  ORF Transcript_139454/g.446103 Transcript_139454/m.446103 type:complete len:372 (+) Transcript_139454:123-1238(+)
MTNLRCPCVHSGSIDSLRQRSIRDQPSHSTTSDCRPTSLEAAFGLQTATVGVTTAVSGAATASLQRSMSNPGASSSSKQCSCQAKSAACFRRRAAQSSARTRRRRSESRLRRKARQAQRPRRRRLRLVSASTRQTRLHASKMPGSSVRQTSSVCRERQAPSARERRRCAAASLPRSSASRRRRASAARRESACAPKWSVSSRTMRETPCRCLAMRAKLCHTGRRATCLCNCATAMPLPTTRSRRRAPRARHLSRGTRAELSLRSECQHHRASNVLRSKIARCRLCSREEKELASLASVDQPCNPEANTFNTRRDAKASATSSAHRPRSVASRARRPCSMPCLQASKAPRRNSHATRRARSVRRQDLRHKLA